MPVLGVFAQGSPAKLYVPVKNVEASSMTTGYAVALCLTAASVDGAQAVMTASGSSLTLPGWLGVANADIASNAYGLIQCWGYAASVYCSQLATSITITLGDALVPGAEKGGLFSTVPTYLNSGFGYVLTVSAPPTVSMAKTANYTSGIVRCF